MTATNNRTKETSVAELWRMDDKISDAKRSLDQAQRQFLRASGWEWTCNTPGAYWLWQKKLEDGRTLVAELDMAVILQCRMMPDPEDCDHE